ncbi:MAG: hypothetical protein ABI895_21475 [Deltaproteobacteria bacterium]
MTAPRCPKSIPQSCCARAPSPAQRHAPLLSCALGVALLASPAGAADRFNAEAFEPTTTQEGSLLSVYRLEHHGRAFAERYASFIHQDVRWHRELDPEDQFPRR